MRKVLIIDDEEKLRALLARIIGLEGFEVIQTGDLKSALKKLELYDFDVILCDVKLPDGNGVDFVRKIKEVDSIPEVILLTAYGNIPDGVQAIKNGAFDYITKGDDNNKIIPLLYKAAEKADLAKRIKQLEKQLGNKHSFDSIIGESKAIQKAMDLAKKVAITDTTVLLTGETGTGKEVFAHAIHQESGRSQKSFVAINCSAFSKDLLESEMFGHKAGAFTGATKDQKGLFEEANHGTIFLDEIGEMALDLQAKLLRVLEAGEFIRVGDSKPTKVDVRIIAATNRDLQQEIEKGSFRSDLFYRISVFQIHLPPLRERLNDIEQLAKHFLLSFSLKTNKQVVSINSDYFETLKQHTWKGNIRELKNVIERSVILCDNVLNASYLPVEMQLPIKETKTGKTLSAFDLASAEKLHIQKVLNYTGGNKTRAAELLNIALTTLYRKISEYGLDS
ncbi:MAG: sigma-54-dependent Fis family transcriptional regulator [Bacteroidetes bacterium]|nr:sigma-54-dependent Fis family transcriptional regulator [Bacteroidota bacterium]MBK8415900.1 sigma-54-dependent Fis family transcriptional regulator [Bacteroidota bacterium]MBK9423028.1 sigma-54-dependent Fis family transcriptional regulator [Bacteroidota bacterium]MBL0072282.1 sigma-54-dependent Fis family transcriptional regulator [Bacteroidota bacterium]